MKVITAGAMALGICVAAGGAVAQDWTGFYAGGAIASVDSDTGLAANAGYNYDMGVLVLGTEAELMLYDGEAEAYAKIRGGYDFDNRLMLFGSLGYGARINDLSLYSLGLGAEFRLSDTLSLRGEYEAHGTSLGSTSDGADVWKIGAGWHF